MHVAIVFRTMSMLQAVCVRVCRYAGVTMHAYLPAYPQAKVKEEEDIEGHVDL